MKTKNEGIMKARMVFFDDEAEKIVEQLLQNGYKVSGAMRLLMKRYGLTLIPSKPGDDDESRS